MFADIINILTMFFITIYKDSRKVKIDRNCVSKCNLYPYFLIQQNLLISGEKMWMSAELKGCVAWFIYFLNLLWVRYNCAKFEHCRICLTAFRAGAFLRPPPLIRELPRKSSSWIGLREHMKLPENIWNLQWLAAMKSWLTANVSLFWDILVFLLLMKTNVSHQCIGYLNYLQILKKLVW